MGEAEKSNAAGLSNASFTTAVPTDSSLTLADVADTAGTVNAAWQMGHVIGVPALREAIESGLLHCVQRKRMAIKHFLFDAISHSPHIVGRLIGLSHELADKLAHALMVKNHRHATWSNVAVSYDHSFRVINFEAIAIYQRDRERLERYPPHEGVQCSLESLRLHGKLQGQELGFSLNNTPSGWLHKRKDNTCVPCEGRKIASRPYRFFRPAGKMLWTAKALKGRCTVALTPKDRDLLKRCLHHEPGAWNDFVDRFIGLIYHVIHHTAHQRSIPLRPEDTEDVAAEILLAIVSHDYQALRQFRGHSSLATYLSVIARRTCVQELMRRANLREVASTNDQLLEESDERPTGSLETLEEVGRLLQKLPAKERDVVRLHYLEGRTYEEISIQLEIPINSIGPILSRAREKLRKGPASKANRPNNDRL
jgi:RNA polymerase sigma-70 factor (ECF subfamily)